MNAVWRCARGLAAALPVLLLGAAAAPPLGADAGPAGRTPGLFVERVTAERVDVTAPPGEAPAVGSRLVVERGGAEIARLEVIAVAGSTVACLVERELGEIRAGDAVRPLEPAAAAAGDDAIRVRQVMGETVYLDAGRAAGLVPGQRAQVVRAGTPVAEIEVEFVSTSSSACRLLGSGEVLAGDRVLPGPAPRSAGGGAGASEEPAVPALGGGSNRPDRPRRSTREPWADLRGSVALRFQGFEDGTEAGRDISQTWAVVNLHLREIGGAPLGARIRLRTGDETVRRPGRPSESERDDRFYELSLAYDPPAGPFAWQAGRLTAGPEVGFDYLDGVLGEYRVTPHYAIGGFYGNRAVVDELAYDAGGQAYGVFLHQRNESAAHAVYAETYVSVIGEYRDGETNREFLSLYGRQGSGSRWSLYERVELDLNRDWRQEASDSSYQVSNLLLAGTYTITKAVRVGITYDERRQFLTLDDRDTPEELFDDALREGLRLNLYLGSGRGLRANLSTGLRRREGSSEDNLTYNGSVYHGNLFGWNLLVGADYASFSGETSEGYRAGLRAQKFFSNGYDLEITVGRSETTIFSVDQDRLSEWVRVAGTAQLGRHVYLIGEYESTTGDELAGQRLFLQLGYRF